MMNTIVYLIRHSEPFKMHKGIFNVSENILIENQKSPLSITGEHLAKKWSKKRQFKNIDIVWSSNYVRTMSTAKYFAQKNNLKVNVDDNFNERVHGVNLWEELPENFEKQQFDNEDYKIGFGESKKEVKERMYDTLIKVINENKGKKIIIVGHSTATAYLLSKWCDISYDSDYKFNNKIFFNGKWEYLQTFKLVFSKENRLLDISTIK